MHAAIDFLIFCTTLDAISMEFREFRAANVVQDVFHRV